jgi:hypothetical protein
LMIDERMRPLAAPISRDMCSQSTFSETVATI